MRSPSSKRLTRWSNGKPKARYSDSCQPAPTPRMRRPPEISSIVSASFARYAGFRKDMHETRGPISTRDVIAAMAAMIAQPSHTPWSFLPSCRNSRWSSIQMESNPTSSARRAIRLMSPQRGVPWRPLSTAMGSSTPIFNGRRLSRVTGGPPWSAPPRSVERLAEAQYRQGEDDGAERDQGPDVGPEVGQADALQHDPANDAQEVRDGQDPRKVLRRLRHPLQGKQEARQVDGWEDGEEAELHRLRHGA